MVSKIRSTLGDLLHRLAHKVDPPRTFEVPFEPRRVEAFVSEDLQPFIEAQGLSAREMADAWDESIRYYRG